MQRKSIEFYSDQIVLRGTLYLPDDFDPEVAYPAIVACSGYTGLNAIYPLLFAQGLTPKGYVVLGFDYRGCGESDGVTGRLLLEEQVKDIRNGITFLKYQDVARTSGIGILGWGMGAGLVIRAAEANSDIDAVAGINGFYNGESFLRTWFPGASFDELLGKIETDRRERVMHGAVRMTDPFEAYPLDPETSDVVDERLRPVKHYNIQVSFELAESIYRFDAIETARRIRQPLFIAHGSENKLHPLRLAEELRTAVPRATFHSIDGKHNDFMTIEDPVFLKLRDVLAGWFSAQLKTHR